MAAASPTAKAVAFISDTEIDDLIAITAYMMRERPDEIAILVTDSPNPAQKVERLRALMSKWKSAKILIFVGAASGKPHPWVTEDSIVGDMPMPGLKEFMDWLHQHKTAPLFAISPPRDLMKIAVKEESLLSDRIIAYYGSFNSRTLASKRGPDAKEANTRVMQQIAATLGSAKKAYYFDTFSAYGGGPNTLTRTSDPDLFANLAPELLRFMSEWNKVIAQGSIQGLAKWAGVKVTVTRNSMGQSGYRFKVPQKVVPIMGDDGAPSGMWQPAPGTNFNEADLCSGEDNQEKIAEWMAAAGYDEMGLRYASGDLSKLAAMGINGLDGQFVFADPGLVAAMLLPDPDTYSSPVKFEYSPRFDTTPVLEEGSNIRAFAPLLVRSDPNLFRALLVRTLKEALGSASGAGSADATVACAH